MKTPEQWKDISEQARKLAIEYSLTNIKKSNEQWLIFQDALREITRYHRFRKEG